MKTATNNATRAILVLAITISALSRNFYWFFVFYDKQHGYMFLTEHSFYVWSID